MIEPTDTGAVGAACAHVLSSCADVEVDLGGELGQDLGPVGLLGFGGRCFPHAAQEACRDLGPLLLGDARTNAMWVVAGETNTVCQSSSLISHSALPAHQPPTRANALTDVSRPAGDQHPTTCQHLLCLVRGATTTDTGPSPLRISQRLLGHQ